MEFTVSGIPNVQIAMRRASHRAPCLRARGLPNSCGCVGGNMGASAALPILARHVFFLHDVMSPALTGWVAVLNI